MAAPFRREAGITRSRIISERAESACISPSTTSPGSASRTSRAARIQAGVLGPALEDQLRPHELTLRHYPQSFEFSTLGGWLAAIGIMALGVQVFAPQLS